MSILEGIENFFKTIGHDVTEFTQDAIAVLSPDIKAVEGVIATEGLPLVKSTLAEAAVLSEELLNESTSASDAGKQAKAYIISGLKTIGEDAAQALGNVAITQAKVSIDTKAAVGTGAAPNEGG